MTRNSFVVRVYDQSVTNGIKKEAEPMAGIVEDVDTGIKHAFHNKDELWKFMAKRWEKISD